jgi:beta-phosphoglucomutase-like phosphatase (HAD superfamily)
MELHIFDMDGTIIDSMGLWGGIEKKYLDTIVIPFDRIAADKMAELSPRDWYIWLAANVFNGTKTPIEVNMEVIDLIIEGYKTCEIYPGFISYVKFLKDNGHRVALATANYKRTVDCVLESHHELRGIFECIITNDDTGGRTSHNKNILYDVCREQLCPISMCSFDKNHTYVYEDSPKAILHASEVGYKNLMYFNSNVILKEGPMSPEVNARLNSVIKGNYTSYGQIFREKIDEINVANNDAYLASLL